MKCVALRNFIRLSHMWITLASKAVLSGTNGLRAAVVVPRRTWFGFGMPKDDDEIAREGQAGIPLYVQMNLASRFRGAFGSRHVGA